jgi:hypothetical protein
MSMDNVVSGDPPKRVLSKVQLSPKEESKVFTSPLKSNFKSTSIKLTADLTTPLCYRPKVKSMPLDLTIAINWDKNANQSTVMRLTESLCLETSLLFSSLLALIICLC